MTRLTKKQKTKAIVEKQRMKDLAEVAAYDRYADLDTYDRLVGDGDLGERHESIRELVDCIRARGAVGEKREVFEVFRQELYQNPRHDAMLSEIVASWFQRHYLQALKIHQENVSLEWRVRARRETKSEENAAALRGHR